jgi:hypothetical protein
MRATTSSRSVALKMSKVPISVRPDERSVPRYVLDHAAKYPLLEFLRGHRSSMPSRLRGHSRALAQPTLCTPDGPAIAMLRPWDHGKRRSTRGGEAQAALLAIIERDGDAVIGAVRDDEMAIEVDFPGGEATVRQFVADHPDATLTHGSFPGRENDGTRAVTLTLPDSDGVVRSHPH